jgi:hypothetical protein
MSVTQAELDRLVKVYNSGVSSHRAGERETTYDKDLRARIAEIARALGAPDPLAPAVSARPRNYLSQPSFRPLR